MVHRNFSYYVIGNGCDFCRYRDRNISCLATVRQYHQDVPQFLHNRPRHFQLHCLKRMPPSIPDIPLENIQPSEEQIGTFTVRNNGAVYTVICTADENSGMPSCTCIDWENFCLPCKHMLAVIRLCPGWDWESLPHRYINFPHFCLDAELIATVSTADAAASVNLSADDSCRDDPMEDRHVPYDTESTTAADADMMPTTADANMVLKLQSEVRQVLTLLSAQTHNIADQDFLKRTVADLRCLLLSFKHKAVPSLTAKQPWRRTRCNTQRRHTVPSSLRRRANRARSRRRLKRFLVIQRKLALSKYCYFTSNQTAVIINTATVSS